MSDTRVVALVGSLRAESVNRRIAEHLKANAPEGVTVEIANGLGDIPFYNEEIDVEPAPAAAQALREQVAAADAVLVLTPEYNGTMPAVLNNTIDWLSRPYGAGSLFGKPFAVVGSAASSFGGKWSHDDTRRSAGIAGAVVLDNVDVSHSHSEIDPLEDVEIAGRFLAALTALAEHQPEAVA
ncbi:NADPH-dependent FMN reductase [Cumulibacter soli]|uniref:NADPH-dependent FMN reductase n=1 Tax=Cumulibacter soli TaxID=2546344 RepID=UPI0010679F01|nr:NAD(P)H-dependent oxidoreductase [Cumulibacter soli]